MIGRKRRELECEVGMLRMEARSLRLENRRLNRKVVDLAKDRDFWRSGQRTPCGGSIVPLRPGENLVRRDSAIASRVDKILPSGGSSEVRPGAPQRPETSREFAERDRAAVDLREARAEAAEIVRAQAATYRRNAEALDRLSGSPLVIDPKTWRAEADRLEALAARL